MNLITKKPEKNSTAPVFVFWFLATGRVRPTGGPGFQIFPEALEGRMSDNQSKRFTEEIAPRGDAMPG
jgi:hypothetical protein